MSVNLPSHYVTQFANNVQLLLQQQGSRLRPFVDVGSHFGKQSAVVDQIGAIAAQPVTGRFQPKDRVDATVTRRFVMPSDFDLNQMIDSFDKLRMITDPSSQYVQNAVNAMGRQMDNLILDAMAGTAYIGEIGTATQAFSSANNVTTTVGGSGACPINVVKLRQARRVLLAGNVDPNEQVYCAINARQHDFLLGETQVQSRDYNERPALVDGVVSSYCGIKFIVTELIDSTGTVDLCPVWVKSGVHLGVWQDVKSSIAMRDDLKGDPWQAYLMMTMGATRLEEAKVAMLHCNQTA